MLLIDKFDKYLLIECDKFILNNHVLIEKNQYYR